MEETVLVTNMRMHVYNYYRHWHRQYISRWSLIINNHYGYYPWSFQQSNLGRQPVGHKFNFSFHLIPVILSEYMLYLRILPYIMMVTRIRYSAHSIWSCSTPLSPMGSWLWWCHWLCDVMWCNYSNCLLSCCSSQHHREYSRMRGDWLTTFRHHYLWH